MAVAWSGALRSEARHLDINGGYDIPRAQHAVALTEKWPSPRQRRYDSI